MCLFKTFLLISLLHSAIPQCNQNCVSKYQSLINVTKENFINKFEDDLVELLQKLNDSLAAAEGNISMFEDIIAGVETSNDKINMKLIYLIEKLRQLEGALKHLNSTKMVEKFQNISKYSNILIKPNVGSENDFGQLEDELSFWHQFLKNIDEINNNTDITNIPNSLQDDLNILESLLGNVETKDCFGKFRDDLKRIFTDLAKLLTLENISKEVSSLEANCKHDKDKAEEIWEQTQNIVDREEDLRNIFNLTRDTLHLAEELELVVKTINDKQKDQQHNSIKSKLDDVEKSFDNKMRNLVAQYEVNKHMKLLEELEDVLNETDGEKASVSEVEGEILEFMNDIECYTQYIANCRYKTSLEAKNGRVSTDCVQKIKLLANE